MVVLSKFKTYYAMRVSGLHARPLPSVSILLLTALADVLQTDMTSALGGPFAWLVFSSTLKPNNNAQERCTG